MNYLSIFRERLKLLKLNSKISTIKFKTVTTALIFGLSLSFSTIASADQYDTKIGGLRQQNNSAAAAKAALAATEETLQAKVVSLQTSIAELQAQIGAQQAKAEEIKKKIVETETELARQRVILGLSLREVYFDEQVSTLEKVASSKNLSEYANEEQYSQSVKNKIIQTVEQINKLKKQLEAQKAEIERILSEQNARQAQLAASQAEANNLLSLNQSQQTEYNNQISANNSKISQLRSQQAAVNARGFVGGIRVGGSGGYPWPNVPFPNTLVDPWGMYKRQCVSYTAWKVANSGRDMPYWGGRGNANLWDDNARAASIPVDSSPRVGDVAVSNAGTYGHVMYVEAVHGDGTISISQYNASWDGRYSEGRRSTSGLVFVHF